MDAFFINKNHPLLNAKKLALLMTSARLLQVFVPISKISRFPHLELVD